jgi:predicted nucleic acid-binding protein
MKKRLYIETSVWNQLQQDERPDWREITERFLTVAGTGLYDLYVSDYVFFELEKCDDHKKRSAILEWIERAGPQVITPDAECEALMERYFETGILFPTKVNKFYDAGHVAVASVHGIEYVLTFNYRHLLKINKMEGFNGVNLLHGYGQVHLTTPEIFIPEDSNEEN